MKLPEIFDYSKAQSEIRYIFAVSILSFRKIVTLILKHEHGVSLSEECWQETIINYNGLDSVSVEFPTGDTVGSKMLKCEITNSGHIHFSLHVLDDRGENTTPRFAWEKMHKEPLNQRFAAEGYWQSLEEFSAYLSKIADVLKK